MSERLFPFYGTIVMWPSAPSHSLSWFSLRVGLCLGNLLALLTTPPVHGALYSCTESSGVTVITDSPAQLRGCTLLTTTTPPSTPERTVLAPELPQPRTTAPVVPQPPKTQTSVLTVPLERIGSLFVVTVQVNGTRPTKMILDTGASHTILSYGVARDLSLWSHHRATSMTMHTAGGTVQAEVVPIDSIRIGEAEVRDLEAAIYDLPEAPPNIEGLLGLNVLGHFLVTLDTVRHRLLLGAHP
jgi:clan AA aspartic protease (TIGR02281 family)